jgi:hypothetical protein
MPQERTLMTIWLKASAAALGLCALTVAATLPVSAVVALQPGTASSVATESLITAVAVKKKKARRPHLYVYGPRRYAPYGYSPGWGGPDTVGSLGYDGYGYGYNRFSGQQYQSCVEDLGYGRVRPCDAGRR